MGLFSRNFEQFKPYRKPSSRIELFFSVIKERLLDIVVLNWIYALFYIPLILCIMFFRNSLLTLIPCFMIVGIGNSGIAKVSRNWSRDEPAITALDFFDSIRKNWKQCMVIGMATGLIPIIINWYVQLFASYGQIKIAIFGAAVAGFAILLWLISLETMHILAVSYNLPLGNIILNGFLMILSHLPTSVGISLLAVLPPALLFLIGAVTDIKLGFLLTIVYMLLIGFSFFWMIKASYANRLCEELINKKSGLPVRIGLADESTGKEK